MTARCPGYAAPLRVNSITSASSAASASISSPTGVGKWDRLATRSRVGGLAQPAASRNLVREQGRIRKQVRREDAHAGDPQRQRLLAARHQNTPGTLPRQQMALDHQPAPNFAGPGAGGVIVVTRRSQDHWRASLVPVVTVKL